nr:AsmA-like C-terminal region-containing protein [Aureimonas leprariae]
MAVGGLLVLALLGALIAPPFIDWTAYRADFEREASRILGQRVVVRGDAAVRLLPFPSVTFADVEVEGKPGDRPLMTAKHFRMDAELAPYLSGEIRIFSMRVEDPVLRLEVGGDGRLAFLPKGGSLPTRAAVVLESITVDNGTILIEDEETRQTRTFTNVAGTFAAQSLVGPASGGGTLSADDRTLAFQFSSGQTDADGRLPMKLTLDDTVAGVTVTADGGATVKDGAPRFEGSLRAETLAPKEAGQGSGGAAPPPAIAKSSALPRFAATGNLAAGPRSLDVTDLRIAVGEGDKPYILTGSGSLAGGEKANFQVVLAGEQIDIDAIAPHGGGSQSATFESRLDAARALLLQVPKPAVPGSIKLTLPVVVAGDTTIRDLAIDAFPAGDGWSVQRFQAELPGRTRMEAAGLLDLQPETHFRGSLLVASRQPSGFSEWLTGDVDPSVRSLNGAGFSATVDLSPTRQSLTDLEIDVGGDRLTGNLQRSGKAGERTIDADLAGGRIDLDAGVALSRLFTGDADSLADARRGSLKLAAGPVSFAGTSADRIDADLAFDGRKLTVARGDLKGLAASDITAKGTLVGFGRELGGRLDVTLASAAPSELIGFLSQRLPPSPALDALQRQASTLGPLRLEGTAATTPGEIGERPTLGISVKGRAAKTDVSLSLLLGNGIYAGGQAGRFGADLALASAEPNELLGQLGVEALPVATPSPLSLKVSLSAGASGPVAASAALRAPGSEIAAEGTLDISPAGIRGGEFAVSAKSDDASPWLLSTGTAFGAAGVDALPIAFGGNLAFGDGKASLRDLEGSVGAVDLSAELEKTPGGPVTGTAFFSQLSVPWLASLVYNRAPVDPAHPDEWSKANFGKPLQDVGRFAVDVTADRMDLGGGGAVGEAAAHVDVAPGEVTLSEARGTFGGGYGTGSLQFRNADGVGAFSASADLQGLDLGALATNGFALPTEDDVESEDGDAKPPGVLGTLDATLKLDGSGQSYAGILSAMTGAGHVAVEDAAFAGTKPGLLANALSAADAQGFDATPGNVARIVAEASRDASYLVPKASADISVIGGVVRFPAVAVSRPGETLTAEGAIDLAKDGLSGSLRLDLDPGEEAVEGAAPAIQYGLGGTLARPTLTPDVQALANFLAVRALEREQVRVEAIQSNLQEKLRLRREARLYRWREADRAAQDEAAATAERVRLERNVREDRQREEDAQRAAEARKAADAQRAAEVQRMAAERARAAAERARARQAQQEQTQAPAIPNFELPPTAATPNPPATATVPTLPGVRQPYDF